ncbi:class I SAM-dependent methyltransferase [Streptomyces sp. TP-A0874]|uniref:class I SAM-dependent methyltransferase n=1 Tax=Streptomyces sp. TP-A0874 TaxID=549819 RepID=UPI000853906F|nr:class I SAM-dependent methyltransferase [Streptomyces sp. TP-A0874]
MAHHFDRHHPRGETHHDHEHDESGLADLLDLDAEVLGSYLDEVVEWVAGHAPDAPRTVVDLGAGTGTGTLALARRFPAAEVVAIDRSPLMLDRLRAAARRQRTADRVRAVRADLDVAWPELGGVDLAWAALSMHHLAVPERVLRDIHAALHQGGLLAVVELDGPPRFLPDDIGLGRPGLETRLHEAGTEAPWNARSDWRPLLEQAGFEISGQRTFTPAGRPAPPGTGRYAQAYLSRLRSGVGDRLSADDRATLDLLLADDGPEALPHRGDLALGGSRTAWAARRP